MHEASDADVQSETTQREPGAAPGMHGEPGAAPGVPPAHGAMGAVEALPLAERAPRYQALADRLRSELERSDPARGDA